MGRPLGFGDLGALRAEAAPLLEPRPLTSRSTAWTGTGRPQRLGELTLLAYPLLVDEGRLSEGADELKAALGQDPFVELHPEDADKRGLVDGGRATVTRHFRRGGGPVLAAAGDAPKRDRNAYQEPGAQREEHIGCMLGT